METNLRMEMRMFSLMKLIYFFLKSRLANNDHYTEHEGLKVINILEFNASNEYRNLKDVISCSFYTDFIS